MNSINIYIYIYIYNQNQVLNKKLKGSQLTQTAGEIPRKLVERDEFKKRKKAHRLIPFLSWTSAPDYRLRPARIS